MANDPKPISPETHAVIRVHGVGDVFVPHETPMSDFHAAVLKHENYTEPEAPIIHDSEVPRDIISAETPNLTAEGAIENQPQFRQAAKEAWYRTMSSQRQGEEAGFTVNQRGQPSRISADNGIADRTGLGGMTQAVAPDALTAFHVHPNDGVHDPHPSPADVAAARQIKRPIMVASKDGLYEIDATGHITQVFKGTDWMSEKKK